MSLAACTGFDPANWQGRVDAEETDFAQRWHQAVGPLKAGEAGLTLLGLASDAGVTRNHGRPGATAGPDALRQALATIPLPAPAALFDAGNIICQGDQLETAQASFAAALADLLGKGQRVIGLGGGHEIAYASYLGLFNTLQARGEQQPKIGIINLDAHFDLRAGQLASSGTPFRQIQELTAANHTGFSYLCLGVSAFANTAALFTRARQFGVQWWQDEDMRPDQLPALCQAIIKFAASVDHLYLTICLDVLPPALAPGVSAPSARGVELAVIEPLIDQIISSGKLRLADIAELNPSLDQDKRTARVAARLVARIAAAWGRST